MKKDFWSKITNIIDRDRWKCLAVVLVIAVMVCGVSCQSKTTSIVDPSRKVTREELAVESIQVTSNLELERVDLEALITKHNEKVKAHNAQLASKIEDLDRQDTIKAAIFDKIGSAVTGWAATGSLPTSGLLGSGLAIGSLLFGVAAVKDKRRADKVITDLKTLQPPTV